MFEFKVNPEFREKTSAGKVLFYCSVCSASYKHEYSLKRHFLRTHVNRAYISTSDLTVFQMRLEGHHTKTDDTPHRYSCNICVKLYKSEREVREHVQQNHQNYETREDQTDFTVLHCSECEAKFWNRRALNCHLRFHKQDYLKTSQPASGEQIKPEPPDSTASGEQKVSSPADGQEVISTEEEGMFTGQDEDKQRGGRQLRERSLIQRGTLFTCTICQKVFQNYGNLLRHRKLSHETSIRKKPADKILPTHRKRKHKRRKNPFLKPKIYHHFLKKVSSMVLYNSRFCLHGNIEHVKQSSILIDNHANLVCEKTTPEPVKQNVINNLNIRLIPTAQIERSQLRLHNSPREKSPKRPLRSTSSTKLNGATTVNKIERSPISYDRPGYWRFLCLVCYQYFPNTLELFTHQDTKHKGVKTTYLEVAKDAVLPIRHSHEPLGEISGTSKHVIGQPSRFKCTKCQNTFNDSHQLHAHLLKCGAERFLKPITIDIPRLTPDRRYGKIKSKKKTNWIRSDPAQDNLLITSMPGYEIMKKPRKSRLELELEEQQEIERKIKLSEQVSPPLLSPSATSVGKQSEYDWQEEDDRSTIYSLSPPKLSSSITKCPYCNLPFSASKVLTRHIQTSCEMRRWVENSPDKSHDKLQVTPIKSSFAQKPPIPHLADILPDSDQDTQGTQDFQFDSPSPRTSKAQARVLSKFIHPARQCGPCYLCKRPNMSRRYTHLQQRSETYVSFVLGKHKFMSDQACICKECDTKYRKEYQKSRSKLKPASQSISSVVKRQTKPAQTSKSTRGKEPPAKSSNSQNEPHVFSIKARKSVSDSIVAKYRTKRQPVTPVRRSTRRNPQTKHSPSSITSTNLPQTTNPSTSHQTPPSNQTAATSSQTEPSDKPSTSREVSTSSQAAQMNKINGIDLNEVAEIKTDITLTEELDEDGLIKGKDYLVENQCDENKYKVIMDFINSSPARVKTTPNNRIDRTTSNITTLIDAVTARVKDQPDLAERLINAINEAATAKKSRSEPTLTSARGSKSLPALSTRQRKSPVSQRTVRKSIPEPEKPESKNGKRKRPTMTEQAYKHMVEMIDLVSRGEFGSADITDLNYIEKYSPDLPADAEEYWAQHESPASTHRTRLIIADDFQSPNSKNVRLANIIDRLSHQSSEAGSSVDSGIDGSFPQLE